MNLETKDGTGLKDHLASEGITRLGRCDPKQAARPGTFEHHLKKVEEDFWGRRFKVYDKWKRKGWGDYQKSGWIKLLTGFVIHGHFKRNDCINYPVQGAAFHCLLWCLIQMVNWLERRKMKSVIVGQIHDSIVADVHKDELEMFLKKVKYVMTTDLQKHWPWVIVPLEVEAEVVPLGGTWFDKEEVPL